MIKCGVITSCYMEPCHVVSLMRKLIEKYQDKTFNYEGEELQYDIGEPAILTTSGEIERKTGGSNGACINLLNSEDSRYNSVSVINLGTVGVNITNCGIMAILPSIQNPGNVDINLVQYWYRMDRNKIGAWRGGFDYEVSQISDPNIRDLIIKLAINITTKEGFCTRGGMASGAYDKAAENHIYLEDAYGYLHGLVSLKKQITTSKEQEQIYKWYKEQNPHCEVCPKNEDGIPECEANCRKDHPEDSDEEFAKNWFGVLDVDHVDGDHTNNDPKNLQTKCSNKHDYKTQKNKEYLNRYKDGKLISKKT